MTALLASQGFVVIAPPHPGNTINEFPNCGTPTAQVNSFLERPQDVIFVLDQMLAENTNPVSPFFGALDADRVGMSGHSFGGLTTYLVEAIEPRVKVAIPMAAAVIGTQSMAVPSLSMLGVLDTRVNNTLIRSVYASSEAPKLLVEIPERRSLRVLGPLLCELGLQPAGDAHPGRGARPRPALGAPVPRGLPERRPGLLGLLPEAAPGRHGVVAASVAGGSRAKTRSSKATKKTLNGCPLAPRPLCDLARKPYRTA